MSAVDGEARVLGDCVGCFRAVTEEATIGVLVEVQGDGARWQWRLFSPPLSLTATGRPDTNLEQARAGRPLLCYRCAMRVRHLGVRPPDVEVALETAATMADDARGVPLQG